MFQSKHHQSAYRGLPEKASRGLHESAFRLFRKYVLSGTKVLDLGSGSGAWAQRLHDASYLVTACDRDEPNERFEFPYYQVDLNQDFGDKFRKEDFDAVCLVEVIEHLENPRHTIRQIRPLLKERGFLFLTTPNASGLYSRLRFFFTGKMAMFTESDYIGSGHITPMTVWHLEKVFSENDFEVLELQFHDAPFFPPRSIGDFAKIIAWSTFRVFMFEKVGGQNIFYVAMLPSHGADRSS